MERDIVTKKEPNEIYIDFFSDLLNLAYPVDWWSLACVLYEFLVGLPPFYSDTTKKIFENILNLSKRNLLIFILIFFPEIEWPDEVPADAKDLLEKLLKLNPEERLGSIGIKQHPFFSDIHWDTILSEDPPFIPQLDHEESTEYFDRKKKKTPYSFFPFSD